MNCKNMCTFFTTFLVHWAILVIRPGFSISSTVLLNDVSPADLSTSFIDAVAVYDNFIIIGSEETPYTSYPGNAYILEYSEADTQWTQKTQLLANDRYNNDRFGKSVDIYENFAIVGRSGAAYIFCYNETSDDWFEMVTLTPTYDTSISYFGQSVALTHNMAIVGSLSGVAFIFEYIDIIGINNNINSSNYNTINSAWIQTATLVASDSSSNNFGGLVAINQRFAVVGGKDLDAVYVFGYNSNGNDTVWDEMAKLTSDEQSGYDGFGDSFGISKNNNRSRDGDGDLDCIIVGARYADSNGDESGYAYIFEYNKINKSWIEVERLVASDAVGYELFGSDVSITNDTAVVSTLGNVPERTYASSIYVFKRNISYIYNTDNNGTEIATAVRSQWVEVSKLITGYIALYSYYFYSYSVAIYDKWVVMGTYASAYMYDTTSNGGYTNSGNLALELEIDYDFETNFVLTGSDGSNYINIDSCARPRYNYYTNYFDINTISNWQWYNFDGCYTIELSDCDDSVINGKTERHGSYTIIIDGDIAGYGGYYTESETHTVCTDKSHFSFCIVPKFCAGRYFSYASIDIVDPSDIELTSHKSVTHSVFYYPSSYYPFNIYCGGDHGCQDITVMVCCLYLRLYVYVSVCLVA